MGSSVPFYAAMEDDSALVAYAGCLGLVLVPRVLPEGSLSPERLRDPSAYGLCYFSVDPVERLHPYGNPPRMVSPATDALIEFHRSRLQGDTFTIGRIYWSDDVAEFAQRTRPAFGKLRDWIKANWRKQENYYIGPGAAEAIEHGVRLVGLGIPVTVIDPKSGKKS
jgi:hypothetical protein